MKRTISCLLAVLMILAMAACGNQTDENTSSGTDENDSVQNDSTAKPEGSTQPNQESGTKVLVVYFSCTGTTKKTAEYISDGLDAVLYEIKPADPYTNADLNYNDDDSRCTKEMKDPDSRPAISGSVTDMSQYDIVFIGYPIWWGVAPRILSTFIESYDFSGKTVIPFCTSGSSDIGSSGTNLEKLTSGATWLSGKRFSGVTSRSDVIDWVNSLGLNVTAK